MADETRQSDEQAAHVQRVVQALRSVGVDNPEVYLYPSYTPCEACGGWDEQLLSVGGGPGRAGRRNHGRTCSRVEARNRAIAATGGGSDA